MIYENSKDNSSRFVLGTKGSNALVVFGINPSTATDVQFDPTIKRIIGFSETLGFDSWLVLNVYPQRAADPSQLDTVLNDSLHKENLQWIKKVLDSIPTYTLCAAWGTLIDSRDYLIPCLKDIKTVVGNKEWYCLGNLTKEGHPRHPLYLTTDESLHVLEMNHCLS